MTKSKSKSKSKSGSDYDRIASTKLNVVDSILKRLNEASAMYQLFGVLCDSLLVDDDGFVRMLHDIPCELDNPHSLLLLSSSSPSSSMKTPKNSSVWLRVSLRYGDIPLLDPFSRSRVRGSPTLPNESYFLHPLLELVSVSNGNVVASQHLAEDFLTEFETPHHRKSTQRIVEKFFKLNLN